MPTISCHLHLRLPCFNWSWFNSWSYLIEAALPQSIYAKDRTLWWFMRTTYLLSWIQKNIKQLRFMSHRYIYIYKDYLIHREVWIWILRIDVTMPTLSSSGSLARLLSDSKIVGISVYYRFANDTVTSILLNSSEAPWFPIRYPKFIDGTVTLAAAQDHSNGFVSLNGPKNCILFTFCCEMRMTNHQFACIQQQVKSWLQSVRFGQGNRRRRPCQGWLRIRW